MTHWESVLRVQSATPVCETAAAWPLFPDKLALINLIHWDIRGNQEVLSVLFPTCHTRRVVVGGSYEHVSRSIKKHLSVWSDIGPSGTVGTYLFFAWRLKNKNDQLLLFPNKRCVCQCRQTDRNQTIPQIITHGCKHSDVVNKNGRQHAERLAKKKYK